MPKVKEMSLKDYMSHQRKRVDKALHSLLATDRVRPSVIHQAMRYSIFAGGKRLRPILCLAAAELSGASSEKVMHAACGLEVIHTYSLVHDDLPSMDDDDVRRGRPTNHKIYGEGMAVLTGDALLTYGVQLIVKNSQMKGVKSGSALDALDFVLDSIGTKGMVGGQVVDLEMAGNGKVPKNLQVSLNGNKVKILDYIHRHKTAALIRASLLTGALLAGASKRQVKALDIYGESIGLAFQIADDILDVVGDKKLLGKKGSDQDNNKLTFPAIYGLDLSRRKAKVAVGRAKKSLKIFGSKATILSELADYIIHRQS